MIRFAWLQFRMQATVAAGALAIVAVVLAVTGPNLVHLYDTTVANCAVQHDCSTATTSFTNADGPLQVFSDLLLLVVPVLIGMFWGAPVVSREFETGTFRLAWTQGVSRTRWLGVKLGLGALMSMAAAGLLSLMVTWWSSQLDLVKADQFNPVLGFSVRDLVPISYAAFAFALGVTAGLLFRRLLPAMLTAFIGFVAGRAVVSSWVRPNSIAPFHKSLPITPATPVSIDQFPTGVRAFESTGGVSLPNAWVYSVKIVDNAGHAPTTTFLKRACPLGNYGPLNPRDCTSKLAANFHQLVTYQPASHYWPMQWYELADLPRTRRRPGRLLLLVDTPARFVTFCRPLWVGNAGEVPTTPTVSCGVVYESGTAFPTSCANRGPRCRPLAQGQEPFVGGATVAGNGVMYVASPNGGELDGYVAGCRTDGGTCSPILRRLFPNSVVAPSLWDGRVLFVTCADGTVSALRVRGHRI